MNFDNYFYQQKARFFNPFYKHGPPVFYKQSSISKYQQKKNNEQSDAELLKGILSGSGNKTKKC